MLAGYILRDLNQSHYLRGGSEMGAKFFTSATTGDKRFENVVFKDRT